MRLFIYSAILSIVFCSCAEQSNNEDASNDDSSSNTASEGKSISTETNVSTPEPGRTTPIISSEEEYPEWMIKKYSGLINNQGTPLTRAILSHEKMDRPISMLIYEQANDSCREVYLASIYDRTATQELLLAQECTGHRKQSRFSFKEYKRLTDYTFQVYQVISHAHSESLDSLGNFKDGYSHLNAEYKMDTIRLTYRVMPSGKIKQVLK